MLFTTGNLITLAIVAVVLVVYRQLDRDNRSLEKVKKLGDRLQGDLDVYVKSRAEDLKQYGIELDVQQQAAKELLKRLQSVEDGLNARAENISAVEKRLGEYDSVLSRLMDMTARVDENLARIEAEGEFTGKLAQRIEGASKSLASLEREIPGLREDFSKDNHAALEVARDEMVADSAKRLADIRALLGEAQAEAAAAVEAAAVAKRDADREFIKAFERARTEAEKFEDAAFEKLRAGSEAKAGRLRETVEEKFAQIGLLAREKAAETQALAKAFKADWKVEADSLLVELRASIGVVEGSVAEAARRSEANVAALSSRGDEAIAAVATRFEAAEEKIAAVEAGVDQRLSILAKKADEVALGLGEKFKHLLAGQKEDFDRRAVEAKGAQAEAIAALKTGQAGTVAEIKAAIDGAREANAAASKEFKALIAGSKAEADALAERLSKGGEESTLKVLAAVERRLDEYGAEVETKFQRLEAVNVDIGILDAALRASMADVGRRVEGDFIAFGKTLDERRKAFEEGFAKEAARLSTAMRGLEEELAALKSRAYENVSKQLKVFEDEFFADLHARKEASEATLAAWKSERDHALVELSARATAEGVAAEKGLSEQTAKAVLDSQTKVFDQLEAVRSRAESIQTAIAAEAKAAHDSLVRLREGLRGQLAEATKTNDETIAAELARIADDSGGRVAAANEAVQQRLAALSASIDAEEARVRETRETVAKAAEGLRAGFQKGLADTEARVRSDFELWKRELDGLVASLRSDYEGQRDLWVKKSAGERDEIRKDVTALAERSAGLRESLESRIAEALAGFSTGYEELVADQGRRAKETLAEIESRTEAFRTAAQDLAGRVDGARAQAFGKIDTEAQRLGHVVATIDREQKAFVAQTRIFERSDELTAKLSASIESMKADLSALESRRTEMAELETQLVRVRKLEEEVNQRLAKFLSEKKRIDALEEGFSRMESVAQGVDRRLSEITGQGDALTEAQARIRKILELSSEAEAKYDRLEKKGEVIDATVEAIDKNFRTVADIEKSVSTLGGELKRLPERIAELDRSLSTVAAGKERADEAARTLGELDSIMKDAERRIAEAQKVREWLARSETRLEEINRQAEEQLKLLSALLKEEGVDKRGKGAPPGSVQDTVRKLARQGWNSDEIARAVKISRGEVELILELGGKGG